ncbi:unnamed protein product [Kuraishia capsulata CBS 1993]|uniref:Zn(2)-C6 fungal-type domain-containing protein n=1 Tax=Kuraishia capsulata CBS 1993 TaxID=1382522 RepID=W6MY32_9ASCO|nr:uncharacterized protein KUCA_T00005924001 [Kuraishia capsulata CBS 1993]CDK29930.1 unnamed protein product [Kuraishia capsulata CBS 1993]
MFSKFDQSFATIELKRAPSSQGMASWQGSNTPTIKVNSFVGITCKSRHGCLSCRSKHKKCDEEYPICGLCRKRNVECAWGNRRNAKVKQNGISKPQKSSKDTKLSQQQNYSSNSRITEARGVEVPSPSPKTEPIKDANNEEMSLSPFLELPHSEDETLAITYSPGRQNQLQEIFQFLERNPSFPSPSSSRLELYESLHTEPERFTTMDESQVVENQNMTDKELLNLAIEEMRSPGSSMHWKPSFHILFPDTLYTTPNNSLLQGLDEKAILCLDHYRSYVARMISMSMDETNFFLKYSMQLAYYDKAILHGVVAWGGMFLLGSGDDDSRWYLESGLAMAREKLTKKNLATSDYMLLFASYIISVGAEISTGDVKNWYGIFLQFKSLLDSYGGIVKLCNDHKGSNEVKWVISNFLFHDVMATQAWISGTLYPMEQYDLIFKQAKILESDGYGPDPLQGCMQELSLVVGEVANEKARLSRLKSCGGLMESDSTETHDFLDIFDAADEAYKVEMEAAFHRNEGRIASAKPSTAQLQHVDDADLVQLHLEVFDLYQNCLNLYNQMVFKESHHGDLGIQMKVQQSMKSLGRLVGSKLQSSLCWPILITGLACVTEQDRNYLKLLYQRLSTEYPVRNVERAWHLLVRCWRTAAKDDIFVDWCDEVQVLGWTVCFC